MDDSRFDALARAFSGRVPRRALLASFVALLPVGAAAKKRKRLHLGKACDGITDRCKHGRCIDGVCTCRDHQEPCRGKCVRLGTCCPRNLPQRCGNQCIPKGACCFARGKCPCNGKCIPCGDCCRDSDCDGGADPCTVGYCDQKHKCRTRTTPGVACTTHEWGVCSAAGRCEVPSCSKDTEDADCPLLHGEDPRCAQRRCVNGRCKPDHAQTNTVVGNLTQGDCLRDVCDGSGGIITVPDDDDVPQNTDCANPRCVDGHLYCS